MTFVSFKMWNGTDSSRFGGSVSPIFFSFTQHSHLCISRVLCVVILFYFVALYFFFIVLSSAFHSIFQVGECIIVCEFAAKSLCRWTSTENRIEDSKVEKPIHLYKSTQCMLMCCVASFDVRATHVCSCGVCKCAPIRMNDASVEQVSRLCVAHLFCLLLVCAIVLVSHVHVGGAVYVHPIRILFYDRRVIMCAVMLNSTYLLWNVLSLLYLNR